MFEHPTQGMKGVKATRLKSAREELPEYSREYLLQRNEQMKAKNQTAQMLLAKARNELILKDLVTRQASYLLVSLRQKFSAFRTTFAEGWSTSQIRPRPRRF
jgi:hypothetical protein